MGCQRRHGMVVATVAWRYTTRTVSRWRPTLMVWSRMAAALKRRVAGSLRQYSGISPSRNYRRRRTTDNTFCGWTSVTTGNRWEMYTVTTDLENLEKSVNLRVVRGKTSQRKCVLACDELLRVLFLTQNMQERSCLLDNVLRIEHSCHSYESIWVLQWEITCISFCIATVARVDTL